MGSLSLWHWIILLAVFGVPLFMIVRSPRRSADVQINWKQLYFSPDGRITVREWWISHIVVFIPMFALFFLATILKSKAGILAQPSTSGYETPNTVLRVVLFVGLIPYLLSAICLNAKRWHDRDYSGWMQLVGWIPVVGIWAFIENGFLRGKEGPNRFGADPLARHYHKN